MRWTGHLTLMKAGRFHKRVFYGELFQGNRPTDKPTQKQKSFMGVVKCNRKNFDVNVEDWKLLPERDLGGED